MTSFQESPLSIDLYCFKGVLYQSRTWGIIVNSMIWLHWVEGWCLVLAEVCALLSAILVTNVLVCVHHLFCTSVVCVFYLCLERCLSQGHIIIFSSKAQVSLFSFFFTVEILSVLLLNTHICQCSGEHNTKPHTLKDDAKWHKNYYTTKFSVTSYTFQIGKLSPL